MGRVFPSIVFVAVLFFILSLTRVTLRLLYRKEGKDDKFALELSMWRGIFFYRLEIPAAGIKLEKPGPELKTKERRGVKPLLWPVLRPVFKIRAEVAVKDSGPAAKKGKNTPVYGPAKLAKIVLNVIFGYRNYPPAFIYLLGHTRVRRFRWQSRIGTGEPSLTGIINGLAWGLKGFTLTFISRLFSPGGAKPFVAIVPDFQKACFNTFLDCIFEVRIGYIILTGFKTLAIKFK